MKKFSKARLVAATLGGLIAVSQLAWADGSAIGAAATKTVAPAKDDGSNPPAYLLVLAGLSAVAFLAQRRKR
jgi:hypothetical protein